MLSLTLPNSLYLPHYFSLVLSFDPYSFLYYQDLYLILPLHLRESERGAPYPHSPHTHNISKTPPQNVITIMSTCNNNHTL